MPTETLTPGTRHTRHREWTAAGETYSSTAHDYPDNCVALAVFEFLAAGTACVGWTTVRWDDEQPEPVR